MSTILKKITQTPRLFLAGILIGLSITALFVGTMTDNISLMLFPAFVAPFYPLMAKKSRCKKN